jgi:hypothetical protein
MVKMAFESQLKEIVLHPKGYIYTVDVEGTDGCITTMTTEVKGDVKVYNGVSPNNDGMNDFFKNYLPGALPAKPRKNI